MKRLMTLLLIIITVGFFVACDNVASVENGDQTNDPFAGATSVLESRKSALFSEYIDAETRNPVIDQITAKAATTTSTVSGFVPNTTTAGTSTTTNTTVTDYATSTVAKYNLEKGYPIILVHGYAGSDNWNVLGLKIDYFYKIAKSLRSAGYTVYTADVNAFGFSADWTDPSTGKFYEGRSTQLKRFVLEVMAQSGAPKVNIVAHSQGGITSRYMISSMSMADKVNSLYTISTPHYGTDLLKIIPKLPTIVKMALENVVMDFFLGSLIAGDNTPSSAHAHQEMLPSYMVTFNQLNPNAKSVQYYSVAGKMSNIYLTSLFYLPHLAFLAVKKDDGSAVGDNDGIVPVYSAKWGTYLGTIEGRKILGIRLGVDHGNEINHPLGLSAHFDAQAFYLDIAKFLVAVSK